ncbi:MAG: hypothetical protein SFX18_02390 [Pirellulales bacterium]|nr:hypothetical protein [Pirellulales bacterium]
MLATLAEKIRRQECQVYCTAVASDVALAQKIIEQLREKGFGEEEITIICSDKTKEDYFGKYQHKSTAAEAVPVAASLGGLVGVSLFGLTITALGAATGGIGLIIAGGTSLWTGGILGGLVGAMVNRGFPQEIADYYEQAVANGQLLMVVEARQTSPDQTIARLECAEKIFQEADCNPVFIEQH